MLSRALVATNVVFAVLFLVSAGLQYNDPSPWLWVAVYLAAALSCMGYCKGIWQPGALVALGSVVAAGLMLPRVSWGAFAVIAQSMEADPRVTAVREFGGLLIVAAWTGSMAVVVRRRKLLGLPTK